MRLYFRYQYYICTCTVFTLIIRDAKDNYYFLNHELFKFGPAKNGVRELMELRIIVCATANRSSELPGSLSAVSSSPITGVQVGLYTWKPLTALSNTYSLAKSYLVRSNDTRARARFKVRFQDNFHE